MIVWSGIEKRYGDVSALAGFSLEATTGEVLGLLGPNGAGKTTALRIALGLAHADAGEVRIGERAAQDPMSRIDAGYLPEELPFPARIRTGEWLEAQLALRSGDDSTARVGAERLGIANAWDRPVRSLSKGMRRRAGLALIAAWDPGLWILDEPTADLDVAGREIVEAILLEARGRGRTVLVSSHVLSEVERVCDRVALVRAGRVVETGTPASFLPAPFVLELRFAESPAPDPGAPAGSARERSAAPEADGTAFEPIGNDRFRAFVLSREHADRLTASFESQGRAVAESVFRAATLRDGIGGRFR